MPLGSILSRARTWPGYNDSVAVFPMRRREFLAALAALELLPSRSSGSIRYTPRFRKPNPFDSALSHIQAGSDEFLWEKEAQKIEERLTAMLRGEALPLAAGYRGTSPLPLRYRRIAEGVSEAEFGDKEAPDPAVAEWTRSLGRVRRAQFYALPGDVIQYEIASDAGYRVGTW